MSTGGRWEYHCLDRTTGREHRLCVEAHSDTEGAVVLGKLGFAVRDAVKRPWERNRRIPAGWEPSIQWVECFLAEAGGRWQSANDLSMGMDDFGIDELHLRISPAKRHFLLQGLAVSLGGDRDMSNPEVHTAETLCWQWMIEAAGLLPSVCLQDGRGGRLVWSPPRIEVPKRLCIILERRGEHERLVEAVGHAMTHRLKDTDRADLEKRRTKAMSKAGKTT